VIRISALRLCQSAEAAQYERRSTLSQTSAALPTLLNRGRITLLIDLARNLSHRAMLLTMYAAGLRRSELCHLKVSSIHRTDPHTRPSNSWSRRGDGTQTQPTFSVMLPTRLRSPTRAPGKRPNQQSATAHRRP
jgi:integrase